MITHEDYSWLERSLVLLKARNGDLFRLSIVISLYYYMSTSIFKLNAFLRGFPQDMMYSKRSQPLL